MNDIYRYSILEDIGLVIQYHENHITYEAMKQLKLDIISDKNFKAGFSFIIDIRKAETLLTEDELKEYGDWVAENLKPSESSMQVLLTSNPEQVVKTTIYLWNESISPLQYEICSTLEASLRWLNIDPSRLNIIEDEIENLSRSTS